LDGKKSSFFRSVEGVDDVTITFVFGGKVFLHHVDCHWYSYFGWEQTWWRVIWCDVMWWFRFSLAFWLHVSPKICDFEVAEELQDDEAKAAAAAASALGLSAATTTKWMRFGNVGNSGAAVNPKAVNRVDSVEVSDVWRVTCDVWRINGAKM
jgi:hypothetical protein